MIVMRIKYKIIRIMQIYTCLHAYKADMHVQDKRTHINSTQMHTPAYDHGYKVFDCFMETRNGKGEVKLHYQTIAMIKQL